MQVLRVQKHRKLETKKRSRSKSTKGFKPEKPHPHQRETTPGEECFHCHYKGHVIGDCLLRIDNEKMRSRKRKAKKHVKSKAKHRKKSLKSDRISKSKKEKKALKAAGKYSSRSSSSSSSESSALL